MKYSLVIPVYRNEESIPDLIDALAGMNRELQGEMEVVLVVDGSPDRSFAILAERLEVAPFSWQLLLHSRNYGSFAAVRSGLEVAEGSFFAAMSADLQEPPELIVRFFRALESGACDVVIGARDSRDDPWLGRMASGIFWRFYKRFVIPDIPEGGVDVFGCTLPFRQQLLAMRESNASMVGQIFWLGFRRMVMPYHRRRRKHGKSAWTLGKKINYVMDSIFSFTDMPIKVLMGAGFVGLFAALLMGVVIIAGRVSGAIAIPGYASTVVTILFFAAINAMGLGIIGSYVWRAYGNSQGRPQAVVMQRKKHASIPGDGAH